MAAAAEKREQVVASRARSAFIGAMGRAVNGVSIVTTDGPLGRFGLTISSMVSVSADPPMLLICINRDSKAHDALCGNGTFVVNVLAAHQQRVAMQFAGMEKFGKPYDFAKSAWKLDRRMPQLRDATATFTCDLESTMPAGSHTIIVGRVSETTSEPGAPLLYTDRAFGRPARFEVSTHNSSTDFVLEEMFW